MTMTRSVLANQYLMFRLALAAQTASPEPLHTYFTTIAGGHHITLIGVDINCGGLLKTRCRTTA